MSQLNRKSWVAAAAALAVGAACTFTISHGVARADDTAMNGQGDSSKMMMQQADKEMSQMKQMAADPQQAQTMTNEMAKMMVMDEMAKKLATRPPVQAGVHVCHAGPGRDEGPRGRQEDGRGPPADAADAAADHGRPDGHEDGHARVP